MRAPSLTFFAFLFLCFFANVGVIEASTPQIEGAPGRIEYWYPLDSSPRRPVTFVVTHDSWGPFGSGRNTARSQSGGKVGVEWWVLADGTILHSDRERRTGHCGQNSAPGVSGDCNARAVGIEFEGYGNITESQIRSGLGLIRFLQERYCIQPSNIAAHRKAPSEGVIMENAGKNMNYRPSCTGIVQGDGLPENVIASAVTSSQDFRTPSLQEIYNSAYGRQYQEQYPLNMSRPLPGSQNIIDSFDTTASNQPVLSPSYTYPGGSTPSQSIPPRTPIFLPELEEGEGDTVTETESKKLTPLKKTDKIFIVYPSSTTTLEVVVGRDRATSTSVVSGVAPVSYAVVTTFGDTEIQPIALTFQQGDAKDSEGEEVASILSRLRDMLLRLFDILHALFFRS